MPANPWLVWVTCVLAACVVVVAVTRAAPAMPVPTCDDIREIAKLYTIQEIRAMGKRAKLTRDDWRRLMECIGDNTKK